MRRLVKFFVIFLDSEQVDKLIDTLEEELNKKMSLELHQKFINEQSIINKQICGECLLGIWNFSSNFNGLILIEDEIKNTNKSNFKALSGSTSIKISENGIYLITLFISFQKSKVVPINLNLNDRSIYQLELSDTQNKDLNHNSTRGDVKSMGEFKFGKRSITRKDSEKDMIQETGGFYTNVKCFHVTEISNLSLSFSFIKGNCSGFMRIQKFA